MERGGQSLERGKCVSSGSTGLAMAASQEGHRAQNLFLAREAEWGWGATLASGMAEALAVADWKGDEGTSVPL